jgi:hypothetical protein
MESGFKNRSWFFARWTFSDGVSGETTVHAPDGNFYDRIDPKDSSSWVLPVNIFSRKCQLILV